MIQFAESEPASGSEQDLSSAGEFCLQWRLMTCDAVASHSRAFAWLERHRPMGREQQYVELGELAARRLREQLDHLADAVRLHDRKRGALLSPVKLASRY